MTRIEKTPLPLLVVLCLALGLMAPMCEAPDVVARYCPFEVAPGCRWTLNATGDRYVCDRDRDGGPSVFGPRLVNCRPLTPEGACVEACPGGFGRTMPAVIP